MKLRTKLVLLFVSLTAIVAFALGGTNYMRAVGDNRRAVSTQLMSIVKTAAHSIDGDAHGVLSSVEQESESDYISIQRYLQSVREDNPELIFLFTIAPRSDGSMYYVVDEAVGADHAALGDDYKVTDEARTALSGQPSVTPGFVTNKWGTFLVGYAPIRDSSGNVVGAIVGDIEALEVLASQRGAVR